MNLVITSHAHFEMKRRRISKTDVIDTVKNSDQVVEGKQRRVIYQKKYLDTSKNKWYLLRVIAEISGSEIKVITAYKTSKIDKYWSHES